MLGKLHAGVRRDLPGSRAVRRVSHPGGRPPLVTPPTRVAAVVFDLDGVLIDSEPVWEAMRREFVLARGGRWPADAQMRMMGMSTREWSSYVGRDLGVGLSPKAVAAAVIKGIRERDALQSAPDR